AGDICRVAVAGDADGRPGDGHGAGDGDGVRRLAAPGRRWEPARRQPRTGADRHAGPNSQYHCRRGHFHLVELTKMIAVTHVGPDMYSIGGTQSVIRVIHDNKIGADDIRVLSTWNGYHQLE